MISKKCRSLNNLTKAAKAAGMVGLGEVSDLGTSVVLGTTKTLQESTWEKKLLIGGLLGNLASGLLDMDLPFVNLGIESLTGIDTFVDNASDIAMGIAGTSLAYKTANNIQEFHNSNKSIDEKLEELGITFDDIEDERIIPVVDNVFKLKQEERNKIKEENKNQTELTEEQEKVLLQQLLAKYGASLAK